MNNWFHITVSTSHVPFPLSEPAIGDDLWGRLRRSFPAAASGTLMPDHLHLGHPFDSRVVAARAVGAFLSGLSRCAGPLGDVRWRPQSSIEPISTPAILRRTMRYGALNPERAGLVDDALAWPYSTYRDIVGAVADPWIDRHAVARALGIHEDHLAASFHRYVAGHDDPLLRAAASSADALPIATIVAAALAATRARPEALQRRTEARAVFLALAQRHGWADGTLLRWLCNVRRKTIHRHRYASAPAGLAAAELCSSDGRLTAYLAPAAHAFVRGTIRTMQRKERRNVHSPVRWRRVHAFNAAQSAVPLGESR